MMATMRQPTYPVAGGAWRSPAPHRPTPNTKQSLLCYVMVCLQHWGSNTICVSPPPGPPKSPPHPTHFSSPKTRSLIFFTSPKTHSSIFCCAQNLLPQISPRPRLTHPFSPRPKLTHPSFASLGHCAGMACGHSTLCLPAAYA